MVWKGEGFGKDDVASSVKMDHEAVASGQTHVCPTKPQRFRRDKHQHRHLSGLHMSNERKRQKKREQQKKKREAIKTRIRKQQGGLAISSEGVIRQAALCPFGPAFVSPGWDDIEEQAALTLVSVVITRKLPDNRLVVGVAMVDRTCLGIKSAFATPPMGSSELAAFLDSVGEFYDDDMEQCDPLIVQSIVFHAIDFARSLGFPPDSDFPAPLFGPRPNMLIDTPHARPARPIYFPGPHDNAPRIIAQLERAVGRGNFGFTFEERALPIPDGPPMELHYEVCIEGDEEDHR